MNFKRSNPQPVLTRSIATFAVAALVIAIAPESYAASGSWNVDLSGNWSTATNWNPAVVPGTAAGDVVNLTFDITAARTVTIDTTSRTAGDLNIGDPSATPFAYTLASSAAGVVLNLDGTGTTAATVDFTSVVANIISAPLTLVDNGIFRSNVGFAQTLSGVISGATKAVTFNNDTDGTVNAASSGNGQFLVTGNNTYTGGTTISDVRVNITTNNTALGAAGGAVTIQNGGQMYASTALATINYAFNIAGNGWLESAGTLGALRLDSGAIVTGSVAMSADSAIGSNSGTGTVNGIVSGAFALNKVGVGTLVLGGANTYSGGTTVSNGALQLNSNTAAGTPAIVLATGGTTGTATRLLINGGVTAANAVNIPDGITGATGQGAVQQTGTGLGTLTGPISITGNPTLGGHFVGGGAASNALVLSGPITSTVQVTQREGFVRYGGGGTGYNSLLVTNTAQVGATNGIPVAATVTLGGSSNGALDLNGFDQTLATVVVGNATNAFVGAVSLGAKTLTLNGDLTAVTSTGIASHLINATPGGTLSFGATNRNLAVNENPALDDLTINGAAITGSGGVTKTGAGALALNSATIAGSLTIAAGTLATGTGSQAGSFTSQSLGFATGTTLRMKVGASGDLINTGALTNAGTTSVRLNQIGGIVPNGTYPLINYTGASPGLGSFALAPVGHATSTLVDNGSTISLNVTGNSRVIWDGTTSTAWTTAATGNWKLQNGGAATDYIESDDVIFQDAPTNSTVNIATNVSPSNVTFTNTTATAYTLTGAGGIAGSTGLTKTGNGSLTLSTPNSFTGDVTLSGGTLVVSMGNAVTGNLGSLANPAATSKSLFITNNATFRNTTTFNDNTGSAAAVQVVFNVGTGGATFDTPTGTTLTLDDGSVAGNASNAAQLQGTGNLTKIGPGVLSLGNGTSNFGTYSGQILVNEGTLTTGSTSTNPFGTTATGTIVASGATLDVKGAAVGAEPLTISGTGVGAAGVLISSVTGGSASGPITLAADSSVGGATALGLSGPISGPFNLTKVGAGTTTLSNTGNSYTGDTIVTAGQVTAGAVGALPTTTDLVLSGGILDPANLTHTVASISGTSGSINQGTVGTGVLRTTQSTATSFTGALTRVKIDMSGSGSFTLGGLADNATGTADVNAGTLILAKTGDDNIHALGAGGIGLVINSGGTAQIAGSTTGGGTGSNLRPTDAPANYSDQIFNLTDVVINTGGTLDLNNHSEVIDSLTGSGTVRTSVAGAARLYTNNGNTSSVFQGVIQNGAGTLELTKQGTGTLTLTGGNTYTGVTNVAGGRLDINGTLASSNVTVSDGASLGGEATIPGLTLGTTAGGNVFFNPNTAGALTVGTLTLTGAANTVDFVTVPTIAGPWTALNYTTKSGLGTIGLANAANYRVAPVVTDTGTSITVNVTGTKNLTWTGAASAIWNNNGDTNWNDGVGADKFFAGDTATFSDGPTVTGVTVTSGVSPLKTTVNSNTANYTFTSTTNGIAGPGNLEKSGSSTLTLAGPNTYSGRTVISAGTVAVAAATSLGNASIGNDIALSGGSRLSYTAAAAVDLGVNRNLTVGTGGGSLSHNNATAAVITVSGNLIGTGTNNLSFHSNAAGAGTFLLTGDNSGYTGRMSVDGPTVNGGLTLLRIASQSAVPAGGSITLNYPAAATTSGNAITLDLQGNVTLPATLALNLTSLATAALSLRSQITGTGNTAINGPVAISGSPAAGTTQIPVIQFAPTAGTQTFNGNITEGPGGFFGTSTTAIASAASFLARGAGNTTFNGTINLPSAAFVRVDNTGVTTINSTGNVWAITDVRSSSTLRLGANNALAVGAPVNIGQNSDAGDSILELNGFSQKVAGLTSIAGNAATARRVTNSSTTLSTLTLDSSVDRVFGNAANTAGNITGNIALVKDGTNVQTIAGTANTYTGATTINAGTLLVTGSITASDMTVNASGTLGGTGTITGSVLVAGGTVAPGASAGTLSTGAFSLTSGSVLKFELATPGVVGGGVNDLLSVTGPLVLGGTLQVTELAGFGNGTYRLANYTSTLTNNGLNLEPTFTAAHPGSFVSVDPSAPGQLNLVVVPEPTAIVSLLAGMGMLASLQRRRRR